MKRLLALVMLTMPLGCSGKSPEPTTPRSTDCRIPDPGPLPPLHAVACTDLIQPAIQALDGDPRAESLVKLNPQVCIHVDEALALAKYLARADEARRALAGCSYVQLEAE